MITKNAWSQSNRSKRYNILVLSIAILREVCKGAQIPSKSLPDSCQIFPRAGKHASLDAFNEGMLTVIFVFARRYFVSLKSSPLLFLLLAEVVFFFCEVITKLILGTCAWAWAWTHDGEKKLADLYTDPPPYRNWLKKKKNTTNDMPQEIRDIFLVNVSSASMTMS